MTSAFITRIRLSFITYLLALSEFYLLFKDIFSYLIPYPSSTCYSSYYSFNYRLIDIIK